jgi:hypothetical protein
MPAIHPFLSKCSIADEGFWRSLKCELSDETFLKPSSITPECSECREAIMTAYAEFPEIYSLMHEREGMRRQTERISDTFLGLTILFSCVGALILGAGMWLHAPIFTLSAAFAFAAAVAFALSSRRIARFGRMVQAKPIASAKRSPQAFIPLRKAA